MLRYQSDVNFDDAAALHREALDIWHLFRLDAERQHFTAAIVSAHAPPSGSVLPTTRSHDFIFRKIDGVWREVNRSGDPIDDPPAPLTGAVKPFSWMLGIWNCRWSDSHDDFAGKFSEIRIDEPNASGTEVIETYQGLHGPDETLWGQTNIGFDETMHTWYRHDRQTSGLIVNSEATGPYSRNMTYFGRTQGRPPNPLDVRLNYQVNEAGDEARSTTAARIEGKYKLEVREHCIKTRE